VLVVIALALTGCYRLPPDRRAQADQLTGRIRDMPGVVAASSDMANSFAQGNVHFWLSVQVAEDITADQLAAITARYLDDLRAVDYPGYQTELDIRRGWNLFAIDSGQHPVTNADQVIAQARDWVALRHEFPGATVSLRATITHPADAPVDADRAHPALGAIELPDPADYIAVTAAVTALGAQFPQLASGGWTISASKAHPADITTSQRLPTSQELGVWNTVNADQTIPHIDAMTINAPVTPPVWMSEKTVSHDPAIATALADKHLPIVATLPAPLFYTATDQLQAHRNYSGRATAPVAITTGGCTPRDYRPDPTEQSLINIYETCRR
jgi:hypothetical protein